MKAKTVQESFESVLKPKSSEEILDATIDFLENGGEKAGDMAFIDDEEGLENEEVFDRMLRVMKSDLKDVRYFEDGDDWQSYEKAENILRKVSADNKAPYIHLEDRDFNYAINPKAKITFGNSYAVGINIILFNYPHVINLIKKWGKSQT